MRKEKKILRKLPVIFYGILAGMVIVLLLYMRFAENADIFRARENTKIKTIDNFQCVEKQAPDAPLGIQKEYTLRLKEVNQEESCLAFYVVHQYVEVYFGGELVYQISPPKGKVIEKTTGSNWILIPLYEKDVNQEIRILVTPVYDSFKDRKIDFLVGSQLEIYLQRLKQDFPQLLVSLLLIVVGIAFIGIALYHYIRKKQDNSLATLGSFALFLGLWRLLDTRFSPLLFQTNQTLLFYMSLTMLILSAVPFVKTIQYRFHNRYRLLFDGCCLIYSVICIFQLILQFTDKMDLRESLFMTHLAMLGAILIIIILIFYDWSSFKELRKISIDKILFLICLVGVMADLLVFYIRKTSSGLLFSMLALLLYIIITGGITIAGYMRQEKLLKEKEAELAASRISIMLSQIQPHFLYNSLNTIYYLCGSNPDKAQKAISDFADYLRGNLDSLKRKTPVTFETEMKHVQIYLSLEKMRFEDELNIFYEIETKAFMLPALTVQPLVENAVKYGMSQSRKTMNLTISTKEHERYYEVIVADNGVGYNPDEKKEDGKSHIGIENVKRRLWEMSRGTLEITGVAGEGTTAVIKLPKEEEIHEDTSSR